MGEQANQNPERKFSQEQYDMLKRCSDAKDMTEWNNWREANPEEDVLLERADLSRANLEKANLQGAILWEAKLQKTTLRGAHLQRANFKRACLQGAEFGNDAKLQQADFSRAIVDGETLIWNCEVDRKTKFEGVVLGNARIYPETKQLLEYNIRRMNWEEWYKKKENRFKQWPVKWFWELSDYGISTGRIAGWFFGLAFLFALIYWGWGVTDITSNYNGEPGIVKNLFVTDGTAIYTFDGEGSIIPSLTEAVKVPKGLVLCRAIYFSVVTMTTLGFGDIYATTDSLARGLAGHILLMIQVLLGYVMLGALVTRFAVLFTAGGPAGKFADDL